MGNIYDIFTGQRIAPAVTEPEIPYYISPEDLQELVDITERSLDDE